MSMESSRRPFDRSREPGPKKPRLMEDPNQRPFPQRQLASGITTMSSTRFRANDRDAESSESGRGGGGYQPQPLPQHHELVNQYKTALAELTFNSKMIINNLTIIAGENQSAAKAIAATICANILEVPNDQKLPSLYLLDSIVKNIGRDYTKYFAAKLPEVFCKAYRQVEPAIHQSMRHLFGTWEGYIPPQTLQAIEKELGFTPPVNGSAASSATIRSNSQSPRPPHGIHVNPKYLERQRLQQSSRIKGVDEITGACANSNEDPERPDRTLGVARPWLDPSVSTPRDAFNDSVLEKSVGVTCGGNEYGSDLSRNLGSGMVRAGDKSWFKAGGVPGTISGQRNGFSEKHSFSNTEAPKYNQPTQNINSIRSSVMSRSWKNSEEEEYIWDEMNSRSTGLGAPNVSNNLSKDSWPADDENFEVEDPVQIRNPYGANLDRELATLGNEKKRFSSFQRHPSVPWQLQEQHSLEELNQKPGHSEGFMSTLSGLPANTNSAVRMGNRSFLPNATTGLPGIVGQQQLHSIGVESPSGQSPLRQQSSPPPVGNLRRPHQKDLPGSFSSATPFQSRHQQQLHLSHNEVTKKPPPLSRVALAKETLEQSTTGSVEAAALNGGTLSSMSNASRLDSRNLPSQLGVRPARSAGPSPATLSSLVSAISAPSSLGPSNNSLSALPKVPERKAGQLTRASTLPPASSDVSVASAQTTSASSNTSNPIANLLSSLVAKGLISAEKESQTKVTSEFPAQLEDERDSITTSSSLPVASVSGSAAVPLPSATDDVNDTAKSPTSLSETTSTEIRNLIGFEFKPDVIREVHPPVIKGLFDDLPHHCDICGRRLKFQEQFNRHLEWHATRGKNDLIRASRGWYPKSIDCIVSKGESSSTSEFSGSVDTYSKETRSTQEDSMVQADESQCLCVLCGEVFEDFYCQESGEWMFKGAVDMTNSDSELGNRNASTTRGPIIHARCFSGNSISSFVKMEQD
ncbi:uncharacterized protein LOC107626412 isoform X1 [Arachis ipaensis]|uniref:uncharacterized protein LOC107626412 isoform X1 n=2 Tax=Arachis ipaensis TaxID=130454 RepID=UPI0007AF2912|nr:uncharacterized protein LOC107626412 isoform X1 [Arachis ipaensis]